ncbi:hypothetical protein HPB50_019098 [Hyalomma asiaticum]|uniref:Uncharacterized protein n=1 Tax=Hyalomma asiaticum TaxID=266040 RepID=A0ACB7SR70_HYAAI|nr:hypothetical protein HPB50_019098 [Hyalomma asiaticum]
MKSSRSATNVHSRGRSSIASARGRALNDGLLPPNGIIPAFENTLAGQTGRADGGLGLRKRPPEKAAAAAAPPRHSARACSAAVGERERIKDSRGILGAGVFELGQRDLEKRRPADGARIEAAPSRTGGGCERRRRLPPAERARYADSGGDTC